jgi:CheY-like chemotaxis protein
MSNGDSAPNDRRRHYRAGITGGAVVRGAGNSVRGQITNLSLGGALIQLADGTHDIELDHDVTVELELGGSGWIVQAGRVQRRSDGHIAIEFARLGQDIVDVIEDEVAAAQDADRSPRVVVVDPREERRHQVAEKLRERGYTSMEAATPLEAIALVEQPRNHVVAVAVAETLTQTGPHELVEFLTESNPHIKLAMFAEEPGDGGTPPVRAPHVTRHGTSDELAASLAASLRRDRG